MVDKYDDDEYVATEQGYEETYPVQRPGGAAMIGKLLQRRSILVPLGIVIVVYIVFKVLNFVHHRSTVEEKGALKSQLKTQIHAQKAVHKRENTVGLNKGAQTRLAAQDSAGAVGNSEVRQNRNAVVNLNQRLTHVEVIINQMNKHLRKQEAILRDIGAYLEHERAVRLRQARRNAKDYHVEAAIPGRAWLKGPHTTTITVAKGTRLPGLGTVVGIEPLKGIVKTTRGVTLRFARNDK